LADMDDGDVRSFAREQHRDGPADAAVAAGDERHLVLELSGAEIEGGVVERRGVELVLVAGLGLVLRREGRLGIGPRPGLHGPAGCRRLAVAGRDLALDVLLLLDRGRGAHW